MHISYKMKELLTPQPLLLDGVRLSHLFLFSVFCFVLFFFVLCLVCPMLPEYLCCAIVFFYLLFIIY